MPDPRIIDYLRTNKDQYPIESLRAALIQQGFSAADVAEAERLLTPAAAPEPAASPEPVAAQAVPVEQPQSVKKRPPLKWIIIGSVCAGAIAIGVLPMFKKKPPPEKKEAPAPKKPTIRKMMMPTIAWDHDTAIEGVLVWVRQRAPELINSLAASQLKAQPGEISILSQQANQPNIRRIAYLNRYGEVRWYSKGPAAVGMGWDQFMKEYEIKTNVMEKAYLSKQNQSQQLPDRAGVELVVPLVVRGEITGLLLYELGP
ncbi:MAG: hypothetical protein COB53_13135 [Elusimicrobia bacterium]|nr:MAG: hypothetical protein COB53_13135 [Elusimicrobiota bacterium]